eukprot:jgi/Astpho2/7367/Aster-01958
MPPRHHIPRAALSVFRQVLRVHRQRLPPPMRSLGDSYMREELCRHQEGSTTPEQWATFTQEWKRYVSMLQGTTDTPSGSGDISSDILASLTPEQKQQLARLKDEASRLGGKPDPNVLQ